MSRAFMKGTRLAGWERMMMATPKPPPPRVGRQRRDRSRKQKRREGTK